MNKLLIKLAGPLAIALAPWIAGCKDAGAAKAVPGKTAEAPQPITNRIDVPEPVRQNLGVTFVKVERRRVAATLRVPGRFEWLPSARREYRTILPARVTLLVGQYEKVEPNQLIAKLDSPEWRRIQHEAVEAEGEIKVAGAAIEVADAVLAENAQAVSPAETADGRAGRGQRVAGRAHQRAGVGAKQDRPSGSRGPGQPGEAGRGGGAL